MNDMDRFWSRVAMIPLHGCWEWTGTRSKQGYGSLSVAGRSVYAHRFAFTALRGSIPDGLQIDHLCRNPSCVNPDHLRVVTGRENNLCGVGPAAENSRRTHCVNGHELSGRNLITRTRGDRTHPVRDCRECRNEWKRTSRRAASTTGWRQVKCVECDGHGIKGVWVGDYEIVSCGTCGGNGALWCSDGDRLALYPGGPFRGMAPGEYAATTAPPAAMPPEGTPQ